MVYSKCRIRVTSPPPISPVVVAVAVAAVEPIIEIGLEFRLISKRPRPRIRFKEVLLTIEKFKRGEYSDGGGKYVFSQVD